MIYLPTFNLFDFHAIKKVLKKIWHDIIDLDYSLVNVKRWNETVNMVRQQLHPVTPTSCHSKNSIILEDIEVTFALTKIIIDYLSFWKPRLTVLTAVEGRGYTTRLNCQSNAGTLTVGNVDITMHIIKSETIELYNSFLGFLEVP